MGKQFWGIVDKNNYHAFVRCNTVIQIYATKKEALQFTRVYKLTNHKVVKVYIRVIEKERSLK